MPELDLLTIGDCSIDLFMKVDKDFAEIETDEGFPELCFLHGSKVPVNSFETSIAGNACNVAVSCNNLGLRVAVYTELGDDQYANRIISELKEHGIGTDYCIKNTGTPTNVHSIIVFQGDRTIFSYHEKRNYKLYDWPIPKWLFYSSLAKGFDKFQGELVEWIKENNVAVAFNPGTQQLREGLPALQNVLKVTSVLFVNKEEAQKLLMGAGLDEDDNIRKLHEGLQGLGPKLTVITLGDKGSTGFDGKDFVEIPAYEETGEIVDKTGAGDAYASGFIAALANKKPLEVAMRWGAVNSSGVIREIGATRGLRDMKNLEDIANKWEN